MSKLLLDWLNNDVILSRTVSNLEEDFRDGYLFGELLFKFNQLSNFREFSSKPTSSAKVNNFILLSPVIQKLGVHFNTRLATEIMGGTSRGAVKTLLSELKSGLDRVSRNSRQINHLTNTGPINGKLSDSGKVFNVIQPSRPLYDKTMRNTFENTIRTLILDPEEALMMKANKKLAQRQQAQTARLTTQVSTQFFSQYSATAPSEQQLSMLDTLNNEYERLQQQEAKRRTLEAKKADEHKNFEQWKQNQRKAKARRELDRRLQSQTLSRVGQRQLDNYLKNREHTLNSINEFDLKLDDILMTNANANVNNNDEDKNNFVKTIRTTVSQPGTSRKKSSLDHNSNDTAFNEHHDNVQENQVVELTYLDYSAMKMGLEETRKKLKEQTIDANVRKGVKDNRRRKFVHTMEYALELTAAEASLNTITDTLLINSVSEAPINTHYNDVLQYRYIMTENKQHRDILIQDMDDNFAQFRRTFNRVLAQRVIKSDLMLDVTSQNSRQQLLQTAEQCATSSNTTAFVKEVVLSVVALTEWLIGCRQVGLFDAAPVLASAGDASEDIAIQAVADPSSTQHNAGAADKDNTSTGNTAAKATTIKTIDNNQTVKNSSVLPKQYLQDLKTIFVEAITLPAAPTLPHQCNYYTTLPQSLEAPAYVVDSNWLLSRAIRVEDIMIKSDDISTNNIGSSGKTAAVVIDNKDIDGKLLRDKNAATNNLAVTMSTEDNITSSNVSSNSDQSMSIADCVALRNVHNFYDEINAAASLWTTQGDIKNDASSNTRSGVGNCDRWVTPEWLHTNSPQHLLGDIIVDIRNSHTAFASITANDSEEPPSLIMTSKAIDLSHIPFKCIVSSLSTVDCHIFTQQLQAIVPGLAVLSMTQLVDKACTTYKRLHRLNLSSASRSLLATSGAQHSADRIGVPVDEVASAFDDEAIDNNFCNDVNAGAHNNAAVEPLDMDDDPVDDASVIDDISEDYLQLCGNVYHSMLTGAVLDDSAYIALFAHAVAQIPPRNNGFVLIDYPNTEQQAFALLQSCAGVDYSQPCRQKNDCQSLLAVPTPTDILDYDFSRCGIDLFVFIGPDDGAGLQQQQHCSDVVEERARARRDMSTNEVTYLTDDQSTVAKLISVDDFSRPRETTALDVVNMAVQQQALLKLFQRAGKARVLSSTNCYKLYDSITTTISNNNSVIAAFVNDLASHFFDPTHLTDEYLHPPIHDDLPTDSHDDFETHDIDNTGTDKVDIDAIGNVNNNNSNNAKNSDDDDDMSTTHSVTSITVVDKRPQSVRNGQSDIAPIQTSSVVDSFVLNVSHSKANLDICTNDNDTNKNDNVAIDEVVPVAAPVLKATPLAPRLAAALAKLWNTAEQQSYFTAKNFFNCVRECWFQLLQRRRAVHDIITAKLVINSDIQAQFDAFCSCYNDVEPAMRFDPDCVAELHLQALELRALLVDSSTIRKVDSTAVLQHLIDESTVDVVIHRMRTEAAALLQCELQRFNTAVNILFDYATTVQGFDAASQLYNELEVVPPPTTTDAAAHADVKSKAKEDKKNTKTTKDSANGNSSGTLRTSIATAVLSAELSLAVPAKVENKSDEPIGKMAKSKPKDKQEVPAAMQTNVLDATVAELLVAIAKWQGVAAADFSGIGSDGDRTIINRDLFVNDDQLCGVVESVVQFEVNKLKQTVAAIQRIVDDNTRFLQQQDMSITGFCRTRITTQHDVELSVIDRLISIIQARIDLAMPIHEQMLLCNTAMAVRRQVLLHPYDPPAPTPVVEPLCIDRLNTEQLRVIAWQLQQLSVILLQPFEAFDDGFVGGNGNDAGHGASGAPDAANDDATNPPERLLLREDVDDLLNSMFSNVGSFSTHATSMNTRAFVSSSGISELSTDVNPTRYRGNHQSTHYHATLPRRWRMDKPIQASSLEQLKNSYNTKLEQLQTYCLPPITTTKRLDHTSDIVYDNNAELVVNGMLPRQQLLRSLMGFKTNY